MKSGKHLVAVIALAAVMAVAVPTALAQTQEYDEIETIFYPNITGVTTAPDTFGEGIDAAKIGLIDAMQLVDSKFEGAIIGAYLDEHQGYLVYFVDIVDGDDMHYMVILDAGTGDVLHEGQKFPLAAIEQMFEEWDQEWEDEYGVHQDEYGVHQDEYGVHQDEYDGKDSVVQSDDGSP